MKMVAEPRIISGISRRFVADLDEDGAWAVLDTGTGAVVLFGGELLVSLDEAYAKTLSAFLNLASDLVGRKILH